MSNTQIEDNRLYVYIWGMIFTAITTLILALATSSYSVDRATILNKIQEGKTLSDMASKGYSPITTTKCTPTNTCTTTVYWKHIQDTNSTIVK